MPCVLECPAIALRRPTLPLCRCFVCCMRVISCWGWQGWLLRACCCPVLSVLASAFAPVFKGDQKQFRLRIVIVSLAVLLEYSIVKLLVSMTPAKWLMLMTWVMAFVGLLNFLADKKWADENRSRRNRQLFRLVRALWIIGILGVTAAVFSNITSKQAAPDFRFYLQGLSLTNGAVITIYSTNGSAPLELWVRNAGDASAEMVQLDVRFPGFVTIKPSPPWRPAYVWSTSTPALASQPVSAATFKAQEPLHAKDLLQMFSLTIQHTNLFPSFVSQASFRATATTIRQEVIFWINVTNGTEKAHFGVTPEIQGGFWDQLRPKMRFLNQ